MCVLVLRCPVSALMWEDLLCCIILPKYTMMVKLSVASTATYLYFICFIWFDVIPDTSFLPTWATWQRIFLCLDFWHWKQRILWNVAFWQIIWAFCNKILILSLVCWAWEKLSVIWKQEVRLFVGKCSKKKLGMCFIKMLMCLSLEQELLFDTNTGKMYWFIGEIPAQIIWMKNVIWWWEYDEDS